MKSPIALLVDHCTDKANCRYDDRVDRNLILGIADCGLRIAFMTRLETPRGSFLQYVIAVDIRPDTDRSHTGKHRRMPLESMQRKMCSETSIALPQTQCLPEIDKILAESQPEAPHY